MKVQQTLGNPAFRHESALWSLEAPPGFVLAAHPGFRGVYFRLWEGASGEALGRLYWPDLKVKYLLSPARPEVLIHHLDTLRVHDLATDTHYELHLIDIDNWQISPGGNLLVLASAKGTRGFCLKQGLIWESPIVADFQHPIRFSSDGSQLVFRREDELDVLWSKDGTRAFRWPLRSGEAWALGNSLYLSDREEGLQCWDLKSGMLKACVPEVRSNELCLSRCERFLASLESRGRQRVLDATSLETVHTADGASVQAFTADGKLVSSGSNYGVRSLCLTDFKILHQGHQGHRRPVRGLAWLGDGSLLSTGWDGRVLRWESGIATEVVQLEAPIDVSRVSPDGSLLAVGGHNLGIVLWDLDKGQPLELQPAGDSMTVWERGRGSRDFDGWLTTAGVLDFSADGTTLIAVLGYDVLATWEVSSGRLTLCEKKTGEFYYAAGGAVHPQGLVYSAMGLQNGTEVALFSWRSGEEKGRWRVPFQALETRMTYGSGYLFFACEDGHLVALNSTSGEVLDQVQLSEECLCLNCTPDGLVAIGTDQGSVFLWRVNEPLRGPYPCLNGGLWSTALAFSPCGRKVAVGHGNGVVSLAEL